MVFFCTFLRKRKSNAKSVTCSYWTRTEKSALLCRRKLSTVSVRIYLYQHIRSTAHYGNWELSDWWEKGNWIATDTIIIDGKQFIWWSIKYTGIKLRALSWTPMEKWLSKNARNSTKRQNKKSMITSNSRYR